MCQFLVQAWEEFRGVLAQIQVNGRRRGFHLTEPLAQLVFPSLSASETASGRLSMLLILLSRPRLWNEKAC